MRAPFITSLLVATCFVGAGCTSAPQQDPPVASHDRACANAAYDPLHMVSSKTDAARDPDIESLLNQSADPRLAWVNRQMYLSLRSLDNELRREQRVAECEQPQSPQMLEARSGGGAPVGGVIAMATDSGTGTSSTSATASSAASQSSIANGTTTGTARSTLVRKSSLSASGAGGNGAVAQKISAGSDNDIVARRLRKAAEQETDPVLRAKLWKEYTDFRQGMAAR